MIHRRQQISGFHKMFKYSFKIKNAWKCPIKARVWSLHNVNLLPDMRENREMYSRAFRLRIPAGCNALSSSWDSVDRTQKSGHEPLFSLSRLSRDALSLPISFDRQQQWDSKPTMLYICSIVPQQSLHLSSGVSPTNKGTSVVLVSGSEQASVIISSKHPNRTP